MSMNCVKVEQLRLALHSQIVQNTVMHSPELRNNYQTHINPKICDLSAKTDSGYNFDF